MYFDFEKNNYFVGYVPRRNLWRSKPVNKFLIKSAHKTKPAAEKSRKAMQKKIENNSNVDTIYVVWSKKQVQAQWNSCNKKIKEKMIEGAHKAAETRKKNGTKKTYILCPRCKSTSKKLYSEMGGLQTRRCTKCGHTFEYDKWIGDRIGSIMIFGNPLKAVEFMRNNPTR